MPTEIRLNKFLADKGYATRRGADTLIRDGKVKVNGARAEIGQKVTVRDIVTVEKSTTPHTYRYILYYKPRGVVTHSPEENDIDIETRVKRDHGMKGIFPIGRLDKDSEGLIILTNDGRITDKILNPQYAHERSYNVIVDKRVTQTFINRLSRGMNIEGYRTRPASAVALPHSDYAFTITLTEGKKHQIRRMCAAGGYQVRELKRTRIMGFELKNLKPGMYHELKGKEQKALMVLFGLQS